MSQTDAYNELFQPLEPVGSLAERIAARLRNLIATERLKAGDRLPAERELARLLGVSRPSLREGIRLLATQGKVAVHPGRGVFVCGDETAERLHSSLVQEDLDVAELLQMRELLEVPASGWAAEKATASQLAEIEAAYTHFLEITSRETPDWKLVQQADIAFHAAILRASGNRFVRRTLSVLDQIMVEGVKTTLSLPGRLQASRAEHAGLLDAIKAGDAPLARHLANAHFAAARSAALEHAAELSTAPSE